MKLQPFILSGSHVPTILGGVNPRTILGEAWWEKERKKAYKSTNNHCICCGTHKDNAKLHKWMEAHECWNIDNVTGVCEVKKIVPVCHYCHSFIHSGRLNLIMYKEKTIFEVVDILNHGFAVLARNGLTCNPKTLEFARSLGNKVNTCGVRPHDSLVTKLPLWQYKLLLNGKYYNRFGVQLK
jgi:hypothetical protein